MSIQLNTNIRIQDFLSLGYLFLLALGLVKDAIYFSFIGINILEYASVTDVLLSPLVFLIKNPIIFLLLLLIAFVIIYQPTFIPKTMNKNKKDQLPVTSTATPKTKSTLAGRVVVLMFTAASFFLGIGIGGGIKIQQKIKNNKIDLNDGITFANKETQRVYFIGQNSTFIFYVEEGANTVTVSPIQGNIKKIASNKFK